MGFFRRAPKETRPFCSAVVAAGGNAVRMGSNKLLLDLCGIPVLGHTLLSLENCPDIDEIVIAARPDDILTFADIVRDFGISKATQIIKGGENRLQSVYAAVRECSRKVELIAVHDGARPFASPVLISSIIKQAARTGAAIPGIALTDTVKQVTNDFVSGTPDRAALRLIQTPQVFEASLLSGALYKAITENLDITDDSTAVEALGVSVAVVSGETRNIKITSPEDLLLAQAIYTA